MAGPGDGRLPRRVVDHHLLPVDVLDAPRRAAEGDDVAHLPLVDELLLQLAQARAVGEHQAVVAAVGDGAAGGDGQHARAGQGRHPIGCALPGDLGRQPPGHVGGVAPGEQVEHRVEGLPAEAGVGRRVAEQLQQLLAGPGLHGHRADDVLGHHVQSVARHARGLQGALVHAPGHHGALHQVFAVERHDAPLAGLVQQVAGAAHPLQAGGHRPGRVELQHQVNGPHVDAELHGAGGQQRRDLPRLELHLDLAAQAGGEAAVVRPRQLAAGQLVEGPGGALGLGAHAHEDQGAGVLADLLVQHAVGVGPDRVLGQVGEVGHRRHHAHVERLAQPGVHHGHRPRLVATPGALLPAEVGGRLLQGVDGGRQAHAHGRRGAEPLQPLQRQRQAQPALAAAQRVHLVGDHITDGGQDLPRPGRGEQDEQRLRRGDQHVGRRAQHGRPLGLAGVARAHRHPHPGRLLPQLLGGVADAAQGLLEVPLHVVVQRLERRDVERVHAPGQLLLLQVTEEAVQAPEEGRQGLAAARGRGDQRVLPLGDGRPAQALGRARGREGVRKPPLHRSAEWLEHGVNSRHIYNLVSLPEKNKPSLVGPISSRPCFIGQRDYNPVEK